MSMFSRIFTVRCPCRNGRLERVEAHNHESERLDATLRQIGPMGLITKVGQDPAVDVGVQRLHSTAEHLGCPGDVGDLSHGDVGL